MPKEKSAKKELPGRPPVEAPAHYVSMAEAVEETGLSYTTVYRHVRAGIVKSRQDGENGPIFVLRSDLPKVQKTDRVASGDRIAIMLRPSRDRFEKWEAAAIAAGYGKVSVWLADLAEKAAALV